MPPLQVKDCPEDVYESLRAYAASENRSISQQTLTIIQDRLNMRAHADGTARPYESLERTHHGESSLSPRDFEMLSKESNLTYIGPRFAGQAPSIYSARRDDYDYAARREKIFARIDSFPTLSLPEDCESSADFVHAAREERW